MRQLGLVSFVALLMVGCGPRQQAAPGPAKPVTQAPPPRAANYSLCAPIPFEQTPEEFDQNKVTTRIQSQRDALRCCYEEALRDRTNLAGKVVINFAIEPTGHVSHSRPVEDSTGMPPFASCIASIIHQLHWSPGPLGSAMHYEYPFVFQPMK